MAADKFHKKYRIPSARAVCHDYIGGDYLYGWSVINSNVWNEIGIARICV